MRTLFTALAFIVILMAVIPAVKRSLYPPRTTPKRDGGVD
jgi:hypothetical protein